LLDCPFPKETSSTGTSSLLQFNSKCHRTSNDWWHLFPLRDFALVTFLGEKKAEEPVIEQMQNLSALENRVDIAELGYFGRPPKVFFAKAEEKILFDKARELREADFDLYRFKPHITLCRIKHIRDYKAYKEKLKK